MKEKNKNITFSKRYKYWFDNMMSRGASAVIMWLGVISLFIVLIAAVVLIITGIKPEDSDQHLGFFDAMWQSLMRTLDPGTMGGDMGWGFRWVMLFVTLGGIFIVSALIGIINNAISDKLDELRKGKSFVVEKNHTLILGWSPKIFSIIEEICIANENQRKPRIVVLADKDKIEMQDEIKARVSDTKNTKVICRSGNPLEMTDLQIVNPQQARCVIILTDNSEDSDIYAIRSVLAITNNPDFQKDDFNIVTEIQNIENYEVIKNILKDNASVILSRDIIARMIVQTCRQTGLSYVFTELLGFDGDEIYFTQTPHLVGKTFAEALLAYDTSSVIGIFDKDKKSHINPPMDTIIGKDDQLIVITEDDDTAILSGFTDYKINQEAIAHGLKKEIIAEKTLILGWNEQGITIVKELDNYIAEGSEVIIVADISDEKIVKYMEEFSDSIKNQKAIFRKADITDRKVIESLDIPSFDHIIVLSYPHFEDIQKADAITLLTLLHIREIGRQAKKSFNVVSEMLDVVNRNLARVTNTDDFIVSDNIISLMIAQLSENKHLKPIFDDLFDADGSEIYLKPIVNYVKPNVPVNFYTLVKSASEKNEIAIGYRRVDEDYTNDDENVVVNPDKMEMITFGPDDKLIVIAED